MVGGKEVVFFFFFFSESAEADCLLKSLIENSKTETSQQGKKRVSGLGKSESTLPLPGS